MLVNPNPFNVPATAIVQTTVLPARAGTQSDKNWIRTIRTCAGMTNKSPRSLDAESANVLQTMQGLLP